MLKLHGSTLRLAIVLAASVVTLTACGGSGTSDDAQDPSTAEPVDVAASTVAGGPEHGGSAAGSADGPVRVTVDGSVYGFTVGRCEIIDEVVYVTATDEDGTRMIEATLPPWDRELAHAQRDGRVSVRDAGRDGPGFDLVAGRREAGTAWDWTVAGSSVTVDARMADRSGTGEPVEVTADIDCPGGQFGSGIYASQFAEPFSPIQPSLTRAPGSVTIGLDGTEYRITYLVHCQFFSESVSAEGTADEASVYLYSEGRGVRLDLLIGDRRAEDDGMRWNLTPEASLIDDFLFEGSDTLRSWSGPIVAADGREAEATIRVECTEGDGFESAGTGTLDLDGTSYRLDQVTACSIDGTEIDFFGHATDGDVSLVVTDGGSRVLLGDETGQQSATFDVEFDVSGQQATWSGTLAGGRQATIAIDCS